MLARRVLDRGRKGFYRTYLAKTERRSYRALQGFVTLNPHTPRACVGRLYNRLNDDYQPLHALCRFFLEQSGPSHEMGDRRMLPFLVDMSRLYELFVAEWLKAHLPYGIVLKSQEKVNIDKAGTLHFDIDLVLYDVDSGLVQCVLDTKYKTPVEPAPEDIAQVVAYSELKDCQEAILVYPTALAQPLNEWIGDNRVRSLTFSLDGDLEEAGQRFLENLLSVTN